MRVFFDINVLLDIGLARKPHENASRVAFEFCDEPGYTRWAAWHSMSTISYIMGRSKGASAARQFINDLAATMEIAVTGTDELLHALSLPMTDFEDAMQLSAATACAAAIIVTRDAGDFAASPIRVCTPEEFIALHPTSSP